MQFRFIRHLFNSSCSKEILETLHILGLLFPCGVFQGLPRVTDTHTQINGIAQLPEIPRGYRRSEPTEGDDIGYPKS